MEEHGIAGNWRGHYSYYKNPDAGSGFNATFIDQEGGLEGRIFDDFNPGEASLKGSFTFPTVTFIKVYVSPGHLPIKYQGTMSGDGKSMGGTWNIVMAERTLAGSWAAHRIDDDEKKEQKEKTSTVKERELEELLM